MTMHDLVNTKGKFREEEKKQNEYEQMSIYQGE